MEGGGKQEGLIFEEELKTTFFLVLVYLGVGETELKGGGDAHG